MLRDKKTGRIVAQYDWSDLRKLYLIDRYSTIDIAMMKGCGFYAVWSALKRQGIRCRDRKDITQRMRVRLHNVAKNNKSLRRYYSDKYKYDSILTKSILEDLYISQKLSIKQIAERFKCGYSTVKSRLVRNNIAMRDKRASALNALETQPHILEEHKKVWKKLRPKIVVPLKDSSIEIKIQNYLKELGVDFFTHQFINNIEHRYQCDILVPSMDLVIECDGDYWHNYPVGNALDHVRTSELLSKGFKVLRLWENEIRAMSVADLKKKLEDLQ